VTLIRGINTGLGTTMVIVSHQVELVLRIADRVMMIDRDEKGIIATGAPEELRLSAIDSRVRNFLFRSDAGQGKG
jgi:phospholipid/cholesterol/gamma-HCH transport system ATP-binding protein